MSRPRYQEVQVRGLIARTAVRLLDRLSAVRPRDLAAEHVTSRPGLASIGIAARVRRAVVGSWVLVTGCCWQLGQNHRVTCCAVLFLARRRGLQRLGRRPVLIWKFRRGSTCRKFNQYAHVPDRVRGATLR
jgi:hypothetical protein